MNDLEIRHNCKPEIMQKRMSTAKTYLTKAVNDFGTEESLMNATIAQRLFDDICFDLARMKSLLTREENK